MINIRKYRPVILYPERFLRFVAACAIGLGIAAYHVHGAWTPDDLVPIPAFPDSDRASQSTASHEPAPDEMPVSTLELSPTDHTPPAVQTYPRNADLTLTVRKGDTLAGLLTGAGLRPEEAHGVIAALGDVYSPRRLKPGQQLRLRLEQQADGSAHFQRFSFNPTLVREITVRHTADGFTAEAKDMPVERRTTRIDGHIDSSLYQAALDAGTPPAVLADFIAIFSYDVDFQRDIRAGDGFSMLYEADYDPQGRLINSGEVLVAEMRLRGTPRRYFRFTDADGHTGYYDEEGRSVRKALLRTPVDGARLSSGYGKRKHPILGYTKMHKGLDFAARIGTPIHAAGDGVVEYAGRKGSYGNYIRIRHPGGLQTAYAHMSRIASRMTPGQRVKQRQVIGYVGSTGRSTGPHLHYEVLKGGRQINPQNIKLPTGKTLKGAEKETFLAIRERLNHSYDGAQAFADATTDEAPGGTDDTRLAAN